MIAAQRVAVGLSVTLLAVAKVMSSAARTSSSSSSSEPAGLCPGAQRLQRLTGVPGADQRRVNDLLLLRPTDGQSRCGSEHSDGEPAEDGSINTNTHLVFFHGDIQNFQEEMSLQPEGAQWLSWSLEHVALTLGRRFPDRHIWVVKACRMYLHKFSCYHNFVQSNLLGAPEHAPYSQDFGAFRHLRALLSHGMERAGLPNPLLPAGGADSIPSGFSLTLVGFSKGCVVLNQMVYELAGAQADPQLSAFVERISDMYWLDGGHPGGSQTWVTDKRALKELAASGMAVHAHVTPYEVCDPMRAWVGREHARFIKTLEEFGARLTQKLHFADEPASIENHFRVISEF